MWAELVVPWAPKQTVAMEAVALSIDTEAQRSETVGIDELLSASPVGCFYQNPQFVTTGAPHHNTIATVDITHEVKLSNQETYSQSNFFTGPRFGVFWQSRTELRDVPGNFGYTYATVASTPNIENAMIRALRAALRAPTQELMLLQDALQGIGIRLGLRQVLEG